MKPRNETKADNALVKINNGEMMTAWLYLRDPLASCTCWSSGGFLGTRGSHGLATERNRTWKTKNNELSEVFSNNHDPTTRMLLNSVPWLGVYFMRSSDYSAVDSERNSALDWLDWLDIGPPQLTNTATVRGQTEVEVVVHVRGFTRRRRSRRVLIQRSTVRAECYLASSRLGH